MTELTITPKVSDKTARFKGTVAAGEHVAVTIKGGAEWLGEDDGANLTLRVLDLVTGRTLAVFPRPAETLEEGETPDAWSAATEDANDLYCELNLNTTRMVAAARHMLCVPVLFVLGDTDDPRTLYFRDRYDIEYWPERIGDTAPYDLDKWPKQIDEWSELVAQFGEALAGHVGNAVAHVTATERATWNSKYAKPVSGIPANDLADGVQSAIAAVPNKADKATTYTKTEVDALVSGAVSGVFVVVDSLPATGGANKIYLVPNGSGAAGNVRDEYMWVNGVWELIGSTQVDLTDYYNKTTADGRFVQKETGKGLVAVDANLATQGAAADAKAVGDALAEKRGKDDLAYGTDDWFVTGPKNFRLVKQSSPENYWQTTVDGVQWALMFRGAAINDWTFGTTNDNAVVSGAESATSLTFVLNSGTYSLAKGDRLALVSEIGEVDISGKADKTVPSAAGNLAALNAQGNLEDSGVKPSDFAAKADLPYALATPGEWEFSGVPSGYLITGQPTWNGDYYDVPWSAEDGSDGGDTPLMYNGSVAPQNATSGTCTIGGAIVTATFKNVLLDRAVNAVAVSSATTLTLPAANPGKQRDFYVRLTASAASAVTWAVAQGETWDAMGAPPSAYAAVTYLYRFTEVAPGVWHCEDMLALVGLEAALAAINGGVAP